MDQIALSEMEELEAEFRLLDEKRRRLQAQKEEHLQQAIETYENDRENNQKDIANKKLALQELEAKYNEELRIKREALQAALQRDATRKRKHEAEVEQLNQSISGLKRMKPSNLELSPRVPQTTSAPSALVPSSGQRPLDGAPLNRTDASSTTEPAQIFDEDPSTRSNSAVRGYPSRGLLDFRGGSRSEPPYQSIQQDSGPAGQQPSTVTKPLNEEALTNYYQPDSSEQGLQPSLAQNKVTFTRNARHYICHPSLASYFSSHPINPEQLSLVGLQITRELTLNPSGGDATWSAVSSRDITAVLCHITGAERPKRCRRCQTDSGIFDKCVVAPSGPSQTMMSGQCSNCYIGKWDQCVWDDEERPASERGSAELSLTTADECLPLPQPIRDNKPDVAGVVVTADASTSEPQQGDWPGPDELSDWSYVEEQSDEESIAEDEGPMGNEHPSSCQAQPRPQALTRKTITYEEVYEAARDPQAKSKHWIFEYPQKSGDWYILRCVEHNLNWGSNVLAAAGKHILGRGHLCSSRKAIPAIKELGELVEDCNKQKADASNAEYQKALDHGYKPNNIMKNTARKGQTKPAQKAKKSAKPRTNQGSGHEPIGVFEGVVDPVVGEIYHAWWDGETRSWYLAVILPYSGDGDWTEVGITGNLFTSGLRKEIPNCFKVAKVATDAGQDALKLSWAKGYQDGGSKVRARKFPCLFLHDPLQIPNADQEFALSDKAEVLAFRTARQLRHRSTILPPGQPKAGVDNHQDLARDFEARLEAIRAKQKNPAPEQEDENKVNAQTSAKKDQQPNGTASVESKNSPCTSPAFDAQFLHHHSDESYLSVSGDGHRDISGQHGLTAWNPRVSLPSHIGNSWGDKYRSIQSADLDQRANSGAYHSVTPTTTHHPSPIGREDGRLSAEPWAFQAANRPSQPMVLKSQNVGSPFALQQLSSQRPRAASALPGEPRGPTALRPFRPLEETEKRSDGSIQQDRASGLRKAVNTVDRDAVHRDAVPNSAGHTSWGPSYSAMLRQPWRSPDTGGRRPENQ